jgi:hypothetical protein
LRLLAGSLATAHFELIRTIAWITPLLIDESTAMLYHQLAFGQRIVDLLRVELDFAAQRALLQSMFTFISDGPADEAASFMSDGFLTALSQQIHGMKDSFDGEIVTAVIVVVVAIDD